jgi:dCMP deaminase
VSLTHDSFLDIARVVSHASTCTRGHVGAVIVQDRRIVSTGYNGAPPGMAHCKHVGNEPCETAIHAELNAIAWAARHGVKTLGGIMYSTHGPCLKCAQAIIAAGIIEVHYETPYRLLDGVDLLDNAIIHVVEHEVL